MSSLLNVFVDSSIFGCVGDASIVRPTTEPLSGCAEPLIPSDTPNNEARWTPFQPPFSMPENMPSAQLLVMAVLFCAVGLFRHR